MSAVRGMAGHNNGSGSGSGIALPSSMPTPMPSPVPIPIRILTWNTLESGEGGAFSDGWGCPLEIRRRDELAAVLNATATKSKSKSKNDPSSDDNVDDDEWSSFQKTAETMLTRERHERLRTAMKEEAARAARNHGNNNNNNINDNNYNNINDNNYNYNYNSNDQQDNSNSNSNTNSNYVHDDRPTDFWLFQEVTQGDAWDDRWMMVGMDNTDDTAAEGDAETAEAEANTASSTTNSASPLYHRVPCPSDPSAPVVDGATTLRRIYVRADSGWSHKRSVPLSSSEALVGGCLAEFEYQYDRDCDRDCNRDRDRDCNRDGNCNCNRNGEVRQKTDGGGGSDGDGGGDRAKETELCSSCCGCCCCYCSSSSARSSLALVNLHGKSRNLRDPELRRQGLRRLWEELRSHLTNTGGTGASSGTGTGTGNSTNDNAGDDGSWRRNLVLCGDWNTQLTDLVEHAAFVANENASQTQGIDGFSGSEVVWETVVGLLNNATAEEKGTESGGRGKGGRHHHSSSYNSHVFSTSHEDGFLAQYDGCLLFRNPFDYGKDENEHERRRGGILELEGTHWNPEGFMPKGRHGALTGGFRYHPGRKGKDNKHSKHENNNSYHNHNHNNYLNSYDNENNSDEEEEEGVYLDGGLLPGSRPSSGLSDHLRIYTDIRIVPHRDGDRARTHGNAAIHEIDTPDKSKSKSHLQSQAQPQQRRPLRDYSESARDDDDDDDGGDEREHADYEADDCDNDANCGHG